MWLGIILGANLWFALHIFLCFMLVLPGNEPKLEYNARNALTWIMIFAFIGAIIGHIFNLQMGAISYG